MLSFFLTITPSSASSSKDVKSHNAVTNANSHPAPSLPSPTDLTSELHTLLKSYDTDGDGKFNVEERKNIQRDYESKKISHPRLLQYDKNGDGKLDDAEMTEVEKEFSTTDSNVRYAGYLRYINTLVRYSAYTSDIGESFRPIVPPRLVTAGYGVSWAYVIGDVAYEGYKARHHQGHSSTEVGQIMVKRAVFQSLASMALPAFLIHSQVKVFGKICRRVGRFQKWGPTVAGLALVPLLPYVLDEPVEEACDYVFDRLWPATKSEKHKKE